ncbi:MAG: HAMP domain-containing sensor histidine kinase [Butyribacter sp.]|nr:HAMP domain-containing sensor histidine kinase [bacterium]MDY3855176.1 HAMP domain-containing sensor histidine kinase [Butyribacter sp.]
MQAWKKSLFFKKTLYVVLICSILISVFSGMYVEIGADYAQFDSEMETDFFVSQKNTQNLLDGYIRLFEEYMQIAGLITTDGDIDYDKTILTSVVDGKNYTIKELLKDSDSEGEASRQLRTFMDNFAENCEKGKSYPWLTRYVLKSDMRVILDGDNIFQFQSPNSVELSRRQISDMQKRRKNMVALTTDMDSFQENLKGSITLRLTEWKNRQLTFHARSNYEEYIVTYFPVYAKYYFLQKAVKAYSADNKEVFTEAYQSFCKKNKKEDLSESKFFKLLQKSLDKYEGMLTEENIPWKAHVLPRTMEEARKYVTFLVETYQEMKYLFSRSHFIFAYENSQNILMTNHEDKWVQIKSLAAKDVKEEKVLDSDDIAYAYFNGKGYEGKTNFQQETFLMSGNIMEKLKDIGQKFNSGTYLTAVGLDLQGIREQKYEDEFSALYEDSHRKFQLFQMGRSALIVGILIGLFAFLLLAVVCGYSNEQEGIVLQWYDKIWLELQLFGGYLAIEMMIWLLKLWGGADSLMMVLVFGTAVAILLFCCFWMLLSVIKRKKAHSMVQYSLIACFLKKVVLQKVDIKEWYLEQKQQIAFLAVSKKRKLFFFLEVIFLLYLAGCLLFIKLDRQITIYTFWKTTMGKGTVAMIVLSVVMIALLQKNYFRHEQTEKNIIEGTQKILDGNFDYQLTMQEKTGYREQKLIETINQIGVVLEKAVEESVRSERMKTELIANVSHDIKTPLTSVINYIDLLKRLHLQDETAQKYVAVLERKSLRLKTLIDDLVEASKASSGVTELEIHKLNFNELVRQTNAEFEDRFEEKFLELVSDIPEEGMYFQGDGRKVFRVLENLYNNTAKYAMEHTRVYVALEKAETEVVFSMKNISATKLNITPEELTERFVRGDRSRTTEGSGLGLSIAKSLTELMGGKFTIELDGDLYCAKVSFPIVD